MVYRVYVEKNAALANEARALLEPEQILVVEDLCLMVEHARLLTLQK